MGDSYESEPREAWASRRMREAIMPRFGASAIADAALTHLVVTLSPAAVSRVTKKEAGHLREALAQITDRHIRRHDNLDDDAELLAVAEGHPSGDSDPGIWRPHLHLGYVARAVVAGADGAPRLVSLSVNAPTAGGRDFDLDALKADLSRYVARRYKLDAADAAVNVYRKVWRSPQDKRRVLRRDFARGHAGWDTSLYRLTWRGGFSSRRWATLREQLALRPPEPQHARCHVEVEPGLPCGARMTRFGCLPRPVRLQIIEAETRDGREYVEAWERVAALHPARCSCDACLTDRIVAAPSPKDASRIRDRAEQALEVLAVAIDRARLSGIRRTWVDGSVDLHQRNVVARGGDLRAEAESILWPCAVRLLDRTPLDVRESIDMQAALVSMLDSLSSLGFLELAPSRYAVTEIRQWLHAGKPPREVDVRTVVTWIRVAMDEGTIPAADIASTQAEILAALDAQETEHVLSSHREDEDTVIDVVQLADGEVMERRRYSPLDAGEPSARLCPLEPEPEESTCS